MRLGCSFQRQLADPEHGARHWFRHGDILNTARDSARYAQLALLCQDRKQELFGCDERIQARGFPIEVFRNRALVRGRRYRQEHRRNSRFGHPETRVTVGSSNFELDPQGLGLYTAEQECACNPVVMWPRCGPIRLPIQRTIPAGGPPRRVRAPTPLSGICCRKPLGLRFPPFVEGSPRIVLCWQKWTRCWLVLSWT